MVKKLLPTNNVSKDYKWVLHDFIEKLKEKQRDNVRSIFLTGSYARGDATNSSDLDVWCIFQHIDNNVLCDVGTIIRGLSISYEELEVNPQCFSMEEFQSDYFLNWSEVPIKILDAVLLYGEDLFGEEVSVSQLELLYKRYLADVLMSVRHYISVDEPIEKLTYKKVKTYILKPLMFTLRLERYCMCGYYPESNKELLKSYEKNSLYKLVEYFLNEEKFNNDIKINGKEVLYKIHESISGLLK